MNDMEARRDAAAGGSPNAASDLSADEPRAAFPPPEPVAGVTIFDLDRTLTVRGTYSPFLLFAARTRAPWRLAAAPVVVLLMLGHKAGLITRKRLKELMHRIMIGRAVPASELGTLSQAYAERILRTNLRQDVKRLVDRDRADGRVLILATAAHRFYAAPIARRLGIDQVVATESMPLPGGVTHRIDGPNCYGAAKLNAVNARLTELGLERAVINVRCYSDDYSDLPLLQASDEPVAVYPSAKLMRHARSKGWKVIGPTAALGVRLARLLEFVRIARPR